MTTQDKHKRLRSAFGQFATGITIITTCDKAGKPVGITANSFASVSLEPALVSWCIDKGATRYAEYIGAQYFTINVLNSEQRAVSDLFAKRSWDSSLFNEVEWFAGPHGVPQIPGAIARFQCKTHTLYEGGDHTIIIGAVEEFDAAPQSPLVFFQGDYLTVHKHAK